MTELRVGRPEDAPAQKALWKEGFGDSDADIALFYDVCWRPEESLVLLEDGAVVSMIVLLPQTLTLPGGGEAKAAYTYALTTPRALRGRGYGRQVMAAVDQAAQGLGADCATLVPAEPGLWSYFGPMGYEPCFSTWRTEISPADLPAAATGDRLAEIGPEEYGALRRSLLGDRPAAHYGRRMLAFQEGMCRVAGGGLYRVQAGGLTGCAAAEYREEGRLVLKELLLPPAGQGAGLALLGQALPARVYEVRMPVGWNGLPGGEIWNFGQIKWYNREKAARFGPEGYLGLGFD